MVKLLNDPTARIRTNAAGKDWLSSRLLQASSYCIGNAAYHNQDLYEKLGASIPDLVKLLNDPTARIRTNAAGKDC